MYVIVSIDISQCLCSALIPAFLLHCALEEQLLLSVVVVIVVVTVAVLLLLLLL